MRVLGLQGSPRRKGNTNYLVSAFMQEAERLGAQTQTVDVCRKHILPCMEYIVCEKKGYCPIEDDVKDEIYGQIRWADVIVLASPVFFYNVTAQLKMLIDRCQTMWARKYRLKLRDPGANMRQGCMLAVGATQGKNLFEGLHLTAKYFFDAVDATYDNSLTYWGIEKFGDMAKHPSADGDVNAMVEKILTPFLNRKKVLFACRENACRSQMAGAFAKDLAGDRLEVYTGGSEPAGEINPLMAKVMAEKGIDMAFHKPISIESALEEGQPDLIVTMGCGEACPTVPGATVNDWPLRDPAGDTLEVMREVRDEIEKKVVKLIDSL